jgi:hypothetical protein
MNDDEIRAAHTSAGVARVEGIARIVAAQKMGLVGDPLGQNLEPGFWTRYVERAELLLRIINWNAP